MVITSNCEPIYIATSNQLQSTITTSHATDALASAVKQIPVPQVSPIIDTNCAGDAFVGGFLAYLIDNAFDQHGQLITDCLSLRDQDVHCILTQATHAATRCAQAIMQSIGCDTTTIKRLHEKQTRSTFNRQCT